MTSEGPDADEAGAPPVLPGRDRELAFLLERLAQAQAGRGCIVTVAGDAGIGKSRLLDAVAGHATTAAITTWWGRCYETPGAPAFWPWTRVLRPVWRRFDEATLRALLGSGYADLETLARDETLTDSGAAGTVSGGSGDAIESRFRLFDSFSRLLHAVAGRTLPLLEHAPTGTAVAGPRGLLLLFDDLHYADASSLLLLEFVAEELATTPLLVLATYRDADLDSGHPLTRTLSRLARLPWRHHLDLGGLDTPAIKELAREAGVAILSDDQADQLRRESEGNPFFAGELLRYRRDSGDGGGRALLPDTLRGVLGARLARLSEPARRTLTLASVFGREFSVWAIQQAGEGAEHSVLDALEEAETNRVIAPADVPGAYRFAHGLLRDAVYDDIAASRRARLHLRAGEALAQRLAGEPEHLAALAYHFAQAIPAGGAAAAHQYAVRAAEYATRMHAHEDSVQLYGLALQALTPIGAVDQQQRCETLIALAESQNRAGEGPVARATFGQAAALAQAMLDSALKQFPTPDVHVPAMLLTRAALGIGHLSVTAGAGHEVLVQLLERAQSALGERDSAQRAMVLARLARELFFTGAPERALRLGHEANAIARRLGDSRALFDCLFSYCYLISGPDHDAERFAVTEEMLQLADSLHDAELQLYAGRRHINNLMEQGNLNGVHEHIAAFARTAAVLRQPFYLWQAGLYRAMEALLDRPLDEAERLIDQAFAARRQPDDADIRAFRAMQLLAIRRQQGRCAEQVEGAVQVVERYPGVPAHRAMLTLLLAESGRFDEARAQLQWFRDHAFATPPRDKSWFSLCAYLAEACVILNDGENAAHLYQHAAGYGHVLVTVSNAVACHGSLSRYLGLLAVTAGSRLALADGVIAQETPDDPTGSSSISAASPAEQAAERHFTAALVFNEARGLRHQLALTRIDYATFLLSGLAKDLGWTAGDGAPPLSTAQQHTADRAHALLMAAAASASALGMSALAKQTRQVLASYGGLCGATPDSGVAATDTLPPAEVVDSPDGGSLAAARAMTAAVSTTADSDPALPPMPPTVLIGRDQDVDVVLERLGHGGIRLLTLTGPPGVGKTRLATEVALLAPAVFPDGVRWVSLDTSRDRSMALSAIAAALRLPHSALGDVPGRLARAIAGQRLLLVLDNLEQVLDLAEDLPVLLSGCPNLAVLATSRAPLRLRWEHEHPVPPLEVLQTGATSLHDAQPPDATAPLSPAAELFIVRAKAMRPNLPLSSEELSAIEAICTRLDGLPLAIELAAARVKLMTPRSLLSRLEALLPVLTGGARDLPARHRTLRDAIAWGYVLLAPEEQAVFRAMGVLAGSFTLEAVEAVAGTMVAGRLVEDILTALLNQALVQTVASHPDHRGDETRFRLLAVIREYAAEALQTAGEVEALTRRHAAYFLDRAEQMARQLFEAEQLRAIQYLDADSDNLEAALAWCIEHDHGEWALRMCAALWRFWELRSTHTTARRWLRKVLAMPAPASPRVRAEVLTGAAMLAIFQADYTEARGLAGESLRLWRELDDHEGIALTLYHLARAAYFAGEEDEAEGYAQESLALWRGLHQPVMMAKALNHLGTMAHLRGDITGALSFFDEAVALSRTAGDANELSRGLSNAGMAAAALGRYAPALECHVEGLHLKQQMGNQIGIAWSLEGLAMVAADTAAHDTAVRLFAAAAQLRETLSSPLPAMERAAYERRFAYLRATLGPTVYESLWQQGRAVTPETLSRLIAGLSVMVAAYEPSGPAVAATVIDTTAVVAPPREPALSQPTGLTQREVEVLALLAVGHTARDIADTLVLSVETVRRHTANIYMKLGVNSRAEATAFALRHGIA